MWRLKVLNCGKQCPELKTALQVADLHFLSSIFSSFMIFVMSRKKIAVNIKLQHQHSYRRKGIGGNGTMTNMNEAKCDALDGTIHTIQLKP